MEVTKVKPVTRTITSANIDRLRVTFGVQSLLETTSKGDRNPSSVRLLILISQVTQCYDSPPFQAGFFVG